MGLPAILGALALATTWAAPGPAGTSDRPLTAAAASAAAAEPVRFVRKPLLSVTRVEDEHGELYNEFTLVVRLSRRLRDTGNGRLEAQLRLDGATGDEGLRRTGAASSHCYEQTINESSTYSRAVRRARAGDRLTVQLRFTDGRRSVRATVPVVSESRLRREVFRDPFGCRRR
jgi:hypothetical protein